MIYIDSNKHCHTSNPDGNFRAFDVPLFDGKCQTFVEGHIYCPEGESYIRDDGKTFPGECVVPWRPDTELYAAQAQYELMMAEAAAAYGEGVDSI